MSALGTPDLVARRLLALVWPAGRTPTEPDAVAAEPSELARWSDYFAVAATARVTVSVGVASVGPEDLAADDDAWFSRADAAMYRAKAEGRNRTEDENWPVEAL